MTEKEENLYNLFGFGIKQVNYLINISETYKYIYFETPKVGCSTIKNTLQKLEVDDESKLPDWVHDKHLSPLLSPLDLEKNFNEYLTNEYFKFSFVRNPYTRILSCYLDKMFGIEKDFFRPKLDFNTTDQISFKDFLLAIKKQSFTEMNPHWMPQHILLGSENITLDFIGKQENFDSDLKHVISKITHIDPNSTTIMNKIPHAVGANEKLKEYITKEVSELIYEIYYDDFVLYGYDRDPFSTKPLAPVEIEKSSTKIFFLIPTCEKYSHKANAIRNTWGKDLHKFEFKHLFLMGREDLEQAMVDGDTLYVPCKDDYESLLLKLTLGYEYLYEHFEFDYVHKIDDDCFLDIGKFKADIYPQIHSKKYFGCKVNKKGSELDTNWHFGKCAHPSFEKQSPKNEVPFDYALGLGYLLHKEVLPALIAHKEEFKKELETYVYSYEDLRIGEILYHHQIVPIQLENYTTVNAIEYIGSTRNLVYDIEDPQLMFKIERDLEDQKLPTPMKLIDSSMVSIIVPAFNVEEDISRCLDSLINQTYQDIEVIVVNDASTDNTRNVIEKYIQMDQRITCIDKETNAGLLQARMTGIKNAKGAYIYSVDSDDYVMPDLVKDTLEEALKHNADIVQFPMKFSGEDSKYTDNWTIRKYQEYTKNNFFMYNGNSWTIMFKKELGDVLRKYIGSLSVNYHEDYIISIILSAFYKKVRYIDTAYYVYCDTDTSMTRQYSNDAILKYIRDTLTFTKLMKGLVPIIFPKENSDYLFTIVSDRIRLMKNQLNLYFKESKNVSIYNLYKNTDKNKTFIIHSMLYEAIQIKDTHLQQRDTQLQQKNMQLKQKNTQLKQKNTQLTQQNQKLNEKNQYIKQQNTQSQRQNQKLREKDQYIKQQNAQSQRQNQKLREKDQYIKQQQSKINMLVNNRWYRFGLMSTKRKIWTIGKVISKKIKIYWLLHPIAKFSKKILGK